MCGRYYVGKTLEQGVMALLNWKEMPTGFPMIGEVRPSERAMVLVGKHGYAKGMHAEIMRWGFEHDDSQHAGKKTLVINARIESVLEKPMFRNAALQRRCVAVASGYFEWNKGKEKVTFDRSDGKPLYMAGIYQRYEDGNHFVVVTTQANAAVKPVHDRMPLILEEHEIDLWLYDDAFFHRIQSKIPVLLERHQEYEQQCMQFI